MLALMKTRHTDTQGEITVSIPLVDMEKVSEAICSILKLTGHTVRCTAFISIPSINKYVQHNTVHHKGVA